MMTLEEIKRWRAEATLEQARDTFISRLDRLIEIAAVAQQAVDAWQEYCDRYPGFRKEFSDHRAMYALAEVLRGQNADQS
jgi:hypothetical protein